MLPFAKVVHLYPYPLCHHANITTQAAWDSHTRRHALQSTINTLWHVYAATAHLAHAMHTLLHLQAPRDEPASLPVIQCLTGACAAVHVADAVMAARPSLHAALEAYVVACETIELTSGAWEGPLQRQQLVVLQEAMPSVEPWALIRCVVLLMQSGVVLVWRVCWCGGCVGMEGVLVWRVLFSCGGCVGVEGVVEDRHACNAVCMSTQADCHHPATSPQCTIPTARL